MVQAKETQTHDILSLLSKIDQDIQAASSIEDYLPQLYAQLEPILLSTQCVIALLEQTSNQVTYPYVVEVGKSLQWAAHPLGNDTVSKLLKSDGEKIANNKPLDLTFHYDFTEPIPENHLLTHLSFDSTVYGVFIVTLSHRDSILDRSQQQQLIDLIGNRLTQLIHTQQLQIQSDVIGVNLQSINQSMQDVMFNLDWNDAIKIACDKALSITKADKAAVIVLDSSRTKAEKIEALGFTDEQTLTPEFLDALLKQSVDQSYPIADITKEFEADSPFVKQAEKSDFSSCAIVPMRSGRTTVAYLTVFHEKIRHYQSSDLSLLAMLGNQLAAAMDNSELLQALELYASEQAQLVHLSRISSSDLSLERVIKDVSSLLQNMLSTDWIQFGLISVEQSSVRIFTSHNDSTPTVRTMSSSDIQLLQKLDEQTLASLQFLRADSSDLSKPFAEDIKTFDLTLVMVTPMVINQKATGYIAVGYQSDYFPGDNDRRLLELASNQLAGQLHNAQLFTVTENALVQRLTQLSMIEDIAQQISSSLDLEQLIANVLEAALQSTQAELAVLALPSPNDNFRIIYKQLRDGEVIQDAFVREKSAGIIGKVAQTGEVLVTGDNRTVPYYVIRPGNPQYLSSLAVPLINQGQVIGVLNVESTKPDFFTDEQAGFIKSLAGHATISIENARLLDERQHQIDILTSLRQLALEISNAKRQEEVYAIVPRMAIQMLSASSSAIYSWIPAENTYRIVKGTVHLRGQYVDDIPPIPDALVERVTKTRKPEYISSVHDNESYNLGEQRHTNYESIILIPIERRSKVTEVLCVMFRQTHEFQPRDYSTVELLTYQVSSHLDNTALTTELRTNHDRMRAILDSTRDGIILLDRAGRLQDANLSAEEILGIELDEYRNEPFAETLYQNVVEGVESNANEELVNMARILRTDPMRIITREYTLQNQAKPIHIKEVGSPVRNARGEIIGRLLSLRDVTEEKSLAAYRELLMRMLLHDLRGPLGAIISSMVLAEELVGDPGGISLQDTLVPTMQVARDSAEQLMSLVDTLLDIAKMRRGQMSLNTESISVQEIAERAHMTLGASFSEANLSFKVDVPAEIELLRVDVRLITRVVTNLLHNAIRFTPDDGSILVTADRKTNQPNMVRVLICDTGPGIPPAMRERIFNEFEQIEGQKPSHGGKGSGLGLAFCKLAVESHDGVIAVEPNGPLPGACIGFTVPLAIDEDE